MHISIEVMNELREVSVLDTDCLATALYEREVYPINTYSNIIR